MKSFRRNGLWRVISLTVEMVALMIMLSSCILLTLDFYRLIRGERILIYEANRLLAVFEFLLTLFGSVYAGFLAVRSALNLARELERRMMNREKDSNDKVSRAKRYGKVEYLIKTIREIHPKMEISERLVQNLMYIICEKLVEKYDFWVSNLGIHSMLLSTDLVKLMQEGVVLDKDERGWPSLRVVGEKYSKYLSEEEKTLVRRVVEEYGGMELPDLIMVVLAKEYGDMPLEEVARLLVSLSPSLWGKIQEPDAESVALEVLRRYFEVGGVKK